MNKNDSVTILGKRKSEKGFSLIELAVVILISGIGIATMISVNRIQARDQDYQTTLDSLHALQDSIDEFFVKNGRYPCPADPTLGPGDPLYGDEQCRAPGDRNPDNCDNMPTDNIVCTRDDTRDADGNGENDTVLIGALPFETLFDLKNDGPLPPTRYAISTYFTGTKGSQLFDAYGMKFHYAVSELMTDDAHSDIDPVNSNLGAMRIQDENKQSVLVPNDNGQYILWSSGANRRGAYTKEGKYQGDCWVSKLDNPDDTPEIIPSGQNSDTLPVDKENCDNNDGIFTVGLRNTIDQEAPKFFDDVVVFQGRRITNLWMQKSNENIYFNTNLNNVGVGTDNPSAAKLQVTDDIAAKVKVESDEYCLNDGSPDPVDNHCLHPEAFGGNISSMACGASEAATEIGVDDDGNPKLACASLFSSPITTKCPDGYGMIGFSNMGHIRCCKLSNPADCGTY